MYLTVLTVFFIQKSFDINKLFCSVMYHLSAPWSSRCGVGWYLNALNGYCYQLNSDKKSWVDSRSACQKQGGDLASIRGLNEQGFISG